MTMLRIFSDPLYHGTKDRIFLEDEDYLCKAYDTEVSAGVEALYAFIRPES